MARKDLEVKKISPAPPFWDIFPDLNLDDKKRYFYGRVADISFFKDDGIVIAHKKMTDGGHDFYVIEKIEN